MNWERARTLGKLRDPNRIPVAGETTPTYRGRGVKARFAGTCEHCGRPIRKGQRIGRAQLGWEHMKCR
jgi:hypothetical protein